MEKKTFIAYTEWADDTRDLSNEEFGELMRAVIEYVKIGYEKQFANPSLTMAFRFMSTDIDRDIAKFQEISDKRAEAGRKGRRAQIKDEEPF